MADLNDSPTLIRRALRVGLIMGAVVLVSAAGTLGYRAWRQHENAVALAIDPRTGVAETMFVRLGGVSQWIQIRGDDRRNPVLLFVHGGPGSTVSPVSSLLQPWEKYFTVVMWDQRDAGKTFARNGAVGENAPSRYTGP
jgi:predicted alpha/beta-fold hydrolase